MCFMSTIAIEIKNKSKDNIRISVEFKIASIITPSLEPVRPKISLV